MPKIKKTELKSKVMLDPADFRKGLPKNKLPELYDKGILLSLTPQKAPLARMNYEGTLKIDIKYNAQILLILNRYIEVRVIDSYEDIDMWIGTLLGITVKGKGG
jgi:hypothetical protein